MRNKNFKHAANFAIIIIARLTLSNSIAWQCYRRYIIPPVIVSATAMAPTSISSEILIQAEYNEVETKESKNSTKD